MMITYKNLFSHILSRRRRNKVLKLIFGAKLRGEYPILLHAGKFPYLENTLKELAADGFIKFRSYEENPDCFEIEWYPGRNKASKSATRAISKMKDEEIPTENLKIEEQKEAAARPIAKEEFKPEYLEEEYSEDEEDLPEEEEIIPDPTERYPEGYSPAPIQNMEEKKDEEKNPNWPWWP